MIRSWLSIAVLASTLYAARPHPPTGTSRLVASGTDDARRFSAVGRMGGCTASLIAIAGAPPTAPVYAVTAGHCIDLGSNNVIVDRADTGRTLTLNYLLDNTTADRPALRSKRVVYSTMQGIDVAVVEFDATEAQVSGLRRLELSPDPPAHDEYVVWAGVPTVGIPQGDQFLRISECSLDGAVDVLEWRWLWHGMLRNDCPDVRGGASGSPLISLRTGQVVGIMGTTTAGKDEDASEFACSRDNPCEIVGSSTQWRRETNYASPVTALAGCFDAAGVFRFQGPRCGLNPGIQASMVQRSLAEQPGKPLEAAIASSTLQYYRYKLEPIGERACWSEAGYSAPLPIAERIAATLPSAEGRYVLCVVAGPSSSYDNSWQQFRFATAAPILVDGTPPTNAPDIVLMEGLRSFIMQFGETRPDEGFTWKAESSETSTCDDPRDYRLIVTSPMAFPEGTRRLCMKTLDAAGNASQPFEVDFGRPSVLPTGVFSSAGLAQRKAARGSWVTIKGVNFGEAGTTVTVRDVAGVESPLAAGYVTEFQINGRLPDSAAIGPATLTVRRADGQNVSTPIDVVAALPELFTFNGAKYGAAAAFAETVDGLKPAVSCNGPNCQLAPIDSPRVMRFFASGLAGSDAAIEISGVALETLAVERSADGIYTIRARMPENLRLRGYVPVRVRSAGQVSPLAYLWLR